MNPALRSSRGVMMLSCSSLRASTLGTRYLILPGLVFVVMSVFLSFGLRPLLYNNIIPLFLKKASFFFALMLIFRNWIFIEIFANNLLVEQFM